MTSSSIVTSSLLPYCNLLCVGASCSVTYLSHIVLPTVYTVLPMPFLLPPPAYHTTKDSQCQTTASTTILGVMVHSGLPCVMPLSPWKGSLYCPPTRATTLSRSQCLHRRLRALGPMT